VLPCPPPSSWGCSVGMLRAPRTPGTRGSLFDGDMGCIPGTSQGPGDIPEPGCRVWGHKDPTGGCCQGEAHRISVLGAPEVVEEQQP